MYLLSSTKLVTSLYEGLVCIIVISLSSGRERTPWRTNSSNFSCNIFALSELYDGTLPFFGVSSEVPNASGHGY